MANTNAQKKDWEKTPVAVYTDSIFFSKYQVKLGSRFRSVGRTSDGAIWIVQRIWTFSKRNRVEVRSTVTSVQKLSDRIELVHSRTGQILKPRFDHLSYSAIWRLED